MKISTVMSLLEDSISVEEVELPEEDLSKEKTPPENSEAEALGPLGNNVTLK